MSNNYALYKIEQDYLFCFDAMTALLPFANPEKFYSPQIMDLHKAMFEAMKDSGAIDKDKRFYPYQLSDELLFKTINTLKNNIPKYSNKKEEYEKKLSDLISFNLTINEVINYFSEERIRLDKILSEFYT